jgi:hypothetical protein
MRKLKKLGRRGEGFVDHSSFLILVFFVIAIFLAAAPPFLQKQQQDTFANELCRTAQVSGQIGQETNTRAQELRTQTGLNPAISWSTNSKVQLGSEISLTLQTTYYFKINGFVSIPMQIYSKASGKSEVYWK